MGKGLTDGHRDSMIESAQCADSMKNKKIPNYFQGKFIQNLRIEKQ